MILKFPNLRIQVEDIRAFAVRKTISPKGPMDFLVLVLKDGQELTVCDSRYPYWEDTLKYLEEVIGKPASR